MPGLSQNILNYGSKAFNMGADALGMGRNIGGAFYRGAAGRFGGRNVTTALGAMGGGLYGGTLGRDQGQGRLAGAFTGALGGAALGRYGPTMARGAAHGFRFGGGRSAGGMGRMMTGAFTGGKAGFRSMIGDGKRAARFIGNSATRANAGFQKIRSNISR